MTVIENQRGPRLSVEGLKAAAAEMRAMDVVSIYAAVAAQFFAGARAASSAEPPPENSTVRRSRNKRQW